jgi:alpha-tubulin suppressor-like RCC1 family protein
LAQVARIRNAVAVSTNDHFDETCALLSTGGVDCWGTGRAGQLGNGRRSDSPVPVAVRAISHAHAIAAGGSHACAVLSRGRLVCWGEGHTTPVAVKIGPVASVSVAFGATCAVLTSGQARCEPTNEGRTAAAGSASRPTCRNP